MSSVQIAVAKSYSFAVLLWTVLAWALIVGTTEAGEATTTAAVSKPPTGPYCGMHCVYAALQSFDKQVEFDTLLDPKYVGSPRGSSVAELARAAEDHGLHTLSLSGLSGLSASSLKASPNPIILHVSRSRQGRTFTHWVLYLGLELRRRSNGYSLALVIALLVATLAALTAKNWWPHPAACEAGGRLARLSDHQWQNPKINSLKEY